MNKCNEIVERIGKTNNPPSFHVEGSGKLTVSLLVTHYPKICFLDKLA